MIGRRISAQAEAGFFRSLANGDLLVAELSGGDLLERRHFSVVRPAHVDGFQIVPPLPGLH